LPVISWPVIDSSLFTALSSKCSTFSRLFSAFVYVCLLSSTFVYVCLRLSIANQQVFRANVRVTRLPQLSVPSAQLRQLMSSEGPIVTKNVVGWNLLARLAGRCRFARICAPENDCGPASCQTKLEWQTYRVENSPSYNFPSNGEETPLPPRLA